MSDLHDPHPPLRPSQYLRVVRDEDVVVLYHTLSGHLHFSPPPILDILAALAPGASIPDLAARFPGLDLPAELDDLHQFHFIASEQEDQQDLAVSRRQDLRYENGELVRVLRLNMTNACNLDCSYCYVTHHPDGPAPIQTMSGEMADRALILYTELLRANHQKKLQIRYFGGEPLLNWDVVRANMDLAIQLARQYQMGLVFLLNTNATLITPAILEQLQDRRPHIRVIISLDGPPEAHDRVRHAPNGQGSYQHIHASMQRLRQAELPFVINAVIGEHNIEHFRELIDIASENGAGLLSLNVPKLTHQLSPQQLVQQLFDAMEYADAKGLAISGMWQQAFNHIMGTPSGVFCGGTGAELSVMPDGSIFPCQVQPIQIGLLDELQTRQLFTSENYRSVVLRSAGNIPECRDCEIEGFCAGSCAGDALILNRNLYTRSQHCEFQRLMMKEYIRRLIIDYKQYRAQRASFLAQL